MAVGGREAGWLPLRWRGIWGQVGLVPGKFKTKISQGKGQNSCASDFDWL